MGHAENTMRFNIPLDQVSVASPCKVSWDSMLGNDQVRFCGQCQQRVFNLSAMTSANAQAIVDQRNGRMCIRFFKRADGTMMARDCPVGLRAIRRRVAMIGSAVLAAVVAGLGFGVFSNFGNGAVMGAMCVPEDFAPVDEAPAPEVGVPARDVK
jgi:hypothetical protein